MPEIRWLGAAAVVIREGDLLYLLDPYVTRTVSYQDLLFNRRVPSGSYGSIWQSLVLAAMSRIVPPPVRLAAVMLGHTHFDHAMDLPLIAASRPEVPIYGSQSLDNLFFIHGPHLKDRVHVVGTRESVELEGGATATFIPSMHSTISRLLPTTLPGNIHRRHQRNTRLRVLDYRLGHIHAVMLQVGGVNILHLGSADFITQELRGLDIHLLLLALPGWKNRPNFVRDLVEDVNPRLLVPIHYDNLFHLTFNPRTQAPGADLGGFLLEWRRQGGDSRRIKLLEGEALEL